MNKPFLVAVSAALLAAPSVFAGTLGAHAPAAIARAPSLPRLPALPAASMSAQLPKAHGWLKYNTQVYPREVQYWGADSAYIAASTGLDFVYDVNDPCGHAPCAPGQNPQKFAAAERAVVQSAPQRGQRAVQDARLPPLPALP
jgi:hypothetical protein